MEKVLITGGSHSELPLIESAKKFGLYVITVGTNKDGLGHKAADKYICGDFSDKEFVKNVAESEKVSAIISGCNDFAYLSASYACERLGLKGHDSYEKARLVHSKDSFRKYTRSLGIPTPMSLSCTDLNEVKDACKKIGFPIVIKPVDLTGGNGVTVCRTEEEALKSAEKAFKVSRQSRILAEEFVEGKDYSTSVILKNGKVICAAFGSERYYMNKYLVSGACTAADLSHESKNTLCRDIEKIFSGLELCDGLFHTQFFVDKSGCPVIIDPCRRTPGDLYIKFAEYSTGECFSDMTVKAELGADFSPNPSKNEERYVARMCIMTDKNGIFKRTIIPRDVKEKIFDSLIWAKEGERIEDFLKYKAGILFLEEKTPEKLYSLFESFHDRVNIEVE